MTRQIFAAVALAIVGSMANGQSLDLSITDPDQIAGIVRSTGINPLAAETVQRLCVEIERKYRREYSGAAWRL